MPTISSSTTFTLPAGQAAVFKIGGLGVATVFLPNMPGQDYTVGRQEAFIGPFSQSASISVSVTFGSISYVVDGDGNMDDQAPPIAALNEAVNKGRVISFSRSTIGAEGDSLVAGAAAEATPFGQWIKRKGLGTSSVGNLAVGGTRADEIAARLPALIALNPGAVLLGGGVNDIIQGASADTVKSRIIANIQTLRAAGIDVIDLGLPPTNTAGNVPAYVKHEIWRRLWCAKNGVKHLDAWAKLATSAGAFTSGLNIDAVHYNTWGASLLVDDLDALWKSPFAAPAPLLAMTDTAADASTFVANAVSFTDSNADGVPNSWFASGSGGTYSIQNADAGGFGKWARCAMTAGSSVGLQGTAATLASLGWVVGDRIAVGFRMRTSDTGQALQTNAYVTGITTSSTQPLYQYKGGETGSDITVYQELVITGGTNINIQFFGSGTGYFEVNRPIVVNLTQMGLA